jgi:3',5'-cyclic AMP phosphodiesterase CpdA
MSKKFVILHLSDVHIGKSGDGVDEDKVRASLLNDVAKMRSEQGLTPNMIVFSGDIVQGCDKPCDGRYCLNTGDDSPEKCPKKLQYSMANQFICELAKATQVDLKKTPIVIVPGNHDVNRHRVDLNQQQARHHYNVETVEKLQIDTFSWKATLFRQAQWLAFARAIQNPECLQWDDKFNVPYGRIKFDGKVIGFTGLNTSWAAFGEKEQQHLWMGRNQLDKLLSKLNGADFKIAVSHHPFNWLHMDESSILKRQLESRTQLYFHGHEHSGWFSDSVGHLVVEGGAIYQDSKLPNTYTWVALDLRAKTGTIHVRQYSNDGSPGWVPVNVPGKIDNGVGTIKALFISSQKNCMNSADGAAAHIPASGHSLEPFPETTADLINTLQTRFGLRWERSSYDIQDGRRAQVFWPVRLRRPTAIHASQCFVAAGLIKTGCSVNLFVDELGKPEYENLNAFLDKLKSWIHKAGGDINNPSFRIHKYSDIAQRYAALKTDTLEQLLKTEIYCSDTILSIAKICTIDERHHELPNDQLAKIVRDIARRRPRRLLTPAMTWTCLQTMYEEDVARPIITLGGHDEKVLWKTWRDCFPPEYAIGHLYISELSGVHLADNTFNWSSSEDIRHDFNAAIASSSRDKYDFQYSMLPWCVSNCVLVPEFIAETGRHGVGACDVSTIEGLMQVKALDEYLNDFVAAVERWVL